MVQGLGSSRYSNMQNHGSLRDEIRGRLEVCEARCNHTMAGKRELTAKP